MWEEQKVSLVSTVEALEKRIRDAKEERDSVVQQLERHLSLTEKSQAEPLAGPSDDPDEEVSKEDVTLLRKQLSETRGTVKFLLADNQLVQEQVDTTKRALDRERATLATASRSLDEARAEVRVLRLELDEAKKGSAETGLQNDLQSSQDQIRLLHDSNKLLREEVSSLQSKLASAGDDLESLKKVIEPLEKSKLELEQKIVTLEAEKASLSRDLETWKDRVNSLVSKFNQIDPEEHQSLKEQVENLKKEKESLNAWKKTTEEESTRIRSIAKNLNAKSREQKTLIEQQKKEIDSLTSEKASLAKSSSAESAVTKERDELREKMMKMEKDFASTKTELEGANSRNDRLRERLRQFQTAIRELRAKEKELEDQLASAQAAAPSPADPTTEGGMGDRPSAVDPVENPLKVPLVGFNFGPSDPVQEVSSGNAEVTSSGEEAPVNEKTGTLRPEAPVYTPPIAAATSDHPQPQADPKNVQETPLAKELPKQATPSASDKKELSMKEKLLEKKRKLQAAVERKRKEAEMAKVSASDQQATKKAKVSATRGPDSRETTATTGQAEHTEMAADISLSVIPTEKGAIKETPSAAVGISTKQEEAVAASEEGEVSVVKAVPRKSEGGVRPPDDVKVKPMGAKKPDTPATGALGMPFGGSSQPTFGTTAFGQSGSVVAPSPMSTGAFGQTSNSSSTGTFGQSSSVAAPISASAASFGSSFLNIKPPGSSSATPVFSFGGSPAIKLPTPSPGSGTGGGTPSPFGAFSNASTFGGFGSSGGPSMTSRPLFGAPPAQAQIPEKGEDEEEE